MTGPMRTPTPVAEGGGQPRASVRWRARLAFLLASVHGQDLGADAGLLGFRRDRAARGDVVADDVSVSSSGFVFAVVLFAVIQSVIAPFLARFAARNASAFLGGIGLLSTFVALVATTIIGDSLRIEGGAVTWISATVIVWLATAAATLSLPLLLVKAGVRSARSSQTGIVGGLP
jgi:hypothetical protein